MVGEITVDSFLDLLGQSDLVSDAKLLALTTEFLSEASRPESPQLLADELVKREILTTWQADMLLQGKHRGFRLGPYRILRPLGQGGMSKVFLAEHEMMHRRSAIKVLPSKYQEDADLLNRFHLEARAVAALDHPNIVRAYDFNKDVRYGKEIHYLVMEYVEGSDLRRMVEEQGPLDCRKAADFICQAALGLTHAHSAGFVHRDIKPANLLVDPHGVLKILDLGLATFTFEAEQTLNPNESSQSAVGTADYVSPEQVLDSRNVDGRADIYSLGLTFYFLLTGHRPFTKPTIMEVLMAHRTEKPEPISKFRPDVPMDLDAIIDKMTAKSPQHRYQTAKDVSEKLQKWQNESGSARTYSRLSALMADAARAKQPSAHDTSPATSETIANSELELKLVDDAPAGSREAADTKKTTENEATENGQATMAETKERTQTQKPSAKSSTLPKAQKLPEKPKVAGSTPGNAGKAIASPHMSTDVLSGLLDEDLLSGLPADDGTAEGQSPLQAIAPRAKKSTDLAGLMKSPWVWVGLGALIVVILLVIVIVAMSGSSSSTTPGGIPSTTSPSPTPSNPAAPPPAPPQASAAPPAPAPSAPIAVPVSPPATPAPTNAAPAPPVAPAPVVPAEKAPEPVKPAETTSPAVPVEVKAPPAVVAEEPKPAEAAKTPDEKAPAVNPDEVLAGLKKISLRLGPSIEPNAKGSLNQSVMNQAKVAARQLGLEIVDKDPNVLEVGLSVTADGGKFNVLLTAELKCPDPGAKDGKEISIWKKSEPILTGDPTKMNQNQVMRVLRTNASKLANKFFDQFIGDLKKAREKAGQK
jgi:eukaryotic-like serine/threonine-protein kinase